MQPHEVLEQRIAEWSGMPHVVACSSGTAALHLALEAFQLPRPSKVIVPDFTMIACPRAVTLAGHEPVFVDCGKDLLMDDGDPMGYATADPYSAFMAVHVYGRRVDMGWISSTAGVCHPVIEDLAEAHGIRPHETTDAACWSFYKNKVIAGQEGGAVAFRDPYKAELARSLRSLGFTEDHNFDHIPRGHNYRLSDVHAELILLSFDKLEENVKARRQMEEIYDRYLPAYCPAEWKMPPRDVPWVYDIRIPGLTEEKQNEIVKAIPGARHGFKPCSQQEEYKRTYPLVATEALRASREVIYLPLTPVTAGMEAERAASTFLRIATLLGR